MMKMLAQHTAYPKDLNTAYAEGYRFWCEGNYRTTFGTDPWSGMPNTDNDVFFFTDKEEAEAFAVQQIWVFNSDIHAKVYTIPEHTETWAEKEERQAREKAERKAKKAEREAQKAEALGMTVEELKELKARKAKANRYARELEDIAEQMKELEKRKAYLKNWLKENGAF